MSSLTRSEKLTRQSYDAIADEWESGHQKPFWQEEFKKLKELLPKGAVIEAGCGAGRDATTLIELGYDYFGTDISEGMVEHAQKVNPTGQFAALSVYDLEPSHSFDAFWCAATLIHIPKKRIDEALRALKATIITKGLGFISVKEGVGEGMEVRDELGGNEFLFAYYGQEEFEEVLDKNNLEVISFRKQFVSARTTWLIYLLRNS